MFVHTRGTPLKKKEKRKTREEKRVLAASVVSTPRCEKTLEKTLWNFPDSHLLGIKTDGKCDSSCSCPLAIMEVLLLVVIVSLFPFRAETETILKPMASKVEGNQILFRDRGYVVNQATFLHVRIPVALQSVLDQTEVLKECAKAIKRRYENDTDGLFDEMDQTYNLTAFGAGYEELKKLHDTNLSDGYLMADYLFKFISDTIERFQGVLKVLPVTKSLNENQLSHNRAKRSEDFTDPWLFGMKHLLKVLSGEAEKMGHEERGPRRQKRFIVGLVALDAASNAQSKIKELLGRFNEFVTKKYAGLVDVVQELGQSFAQLQFDVALLTKLQVVLLSQQPHKFIAAAMYINQQVRNVYDRVIETVTSVQYLRLSPKLLSGEELQQLYKVVLAHAEQHKCDLFIEKASDLFQVEVSHLYSSEDKVLNVFLHVPMVKHQNHLVLKEYVPFPLLQSFELNATVLPDVGDTKYIAVVSDGITDPNLRNRFRTFTEVELSSCRTLGQLYLCPGRNTLKRHLSQTCIGGLLLRDPVKIKENCEMKVSKPGEYIARLQSNEWLISTQEPFSVNAICPLVRAADALRIERQSKIVLPEDCELQTSDHVMTTDLNINLDLTVTHLPCDDLSNVFSNFFEDVGRLKEVVHESLSHRGSISTGDLQHLKQSEIILKDYSIFGSLSLDGLSNFFKLFSGLGGAAMGVVGIGFLVPCLVRQGAFTSLLGLFGGCGRSNTTPSRAGSVQSIFEAFDKRTTEATEVPKVTFSPEVPGPQDPPPPYNPMTFIRQATPRLLRGVMKPAQSLISIASGFRTPVTSRSLESLPRSTREEEEGIASAPNLMDAQDPEAAALPCHFGPITRRGQRPSNFVCTQHLPETGCAGIMHC